MTRSVYIASPEGRTGKSAVALGLLDSLTREVGSVAVFRPLVNDHVRDTIIDVLLAQPGLSQTYEEAHGASYAQAHADPDEALASIVATFGELSERYEMVIVLGSDFTDISSPTEFAFNARIAANLGSPVIMVLSGRDRSPDDTRTAAQHAMAEFEQSHNNVVALVVNRVAPDDVDATRSALRDAFPTIATDVMPEAPILSAPTVREQLAASGASLVQGSDAWLDRESLGTLVAGMTLPNVLDRLFPEATVITPSDRSELLAGLVLAHRSGTFPALAGIILVGGYPIPDSIRRLCEGVDHDLPIGLTERGTYTTAQDLFNMHGPLNVG